MAGMKSLHPLLAGDKFSSEICNFWMTLSFCHPIPFFKGASAHEEIRERQKTAPRTSHSHSMEKRHCLASELPYSVRYYSTLSSFPKCYLDFHQQQEEKGTPVQGNYFIFLFLWALFPDRCSHFLLSVSFSEVVSSRVCSRKNKKRIRNILIPSHSENPRALCLAIIPEEILEISFFHPLLPFLLNEMAATAPPLGSISRPLCWQKKQQITFTWIVRFIIISRWQSLHYNAAKKRLTSFQIKIYNVNTPLWLFVQA